MHFIRLCKNLVGNMNARVKYFVIGKSFCANLKLKRFNSNISRINENRFLRDKAKNRGKSAEGSMLPGNMNSLEIAENCKPSALFNKENSFYGTIMLEIVKRGESLMTDEVGPLRAKIIENSTGINHNNIDAIFLSTCVTEKAFAVGKSYFLYIFKTKNCYNIASIGKFFELCYFCQEHCTKEDKQLIVDIYKGLKLKYSTLDSLTCGSALLGLSITEAWKEGFTLMEMCKLTGNPTYKMFNALVAAAFKNGENKLGWMLMETALQDNKPLTSDIYSTCISTKHGNINTLLSLLEKCDIQITMDLAKVLLKYYEATPNGNANFTAIQRNGKCLNCSKTLNKISLSNAEFEELKEHFLGSVLIGNNIFLKSEPSEIKAFLDLIKNIGKVDIVIDGLNIAYATGHRKGNMYFASQELCKIVTYFQHKGKNILVIGKKHMEKWPKNYMDILKKNASIFLTSDLSSDDPFGLFAAINCGFGTKFISRDLMRGHKFLLKDPKLRASFSKWQQIHQLYFKYVTADGKVILRRPLPYLQSVQKSDDGGWHLPLICSGEDRAGVPGHLVPGVTSWLCLLAFVEKYIWC